MNIFSWIENLQVRVHNWLNYEDPWYMHYHTSKYLPPEAKSFYGQFKNYEEFHKYMMNVYDNEWLYYISNGKLISILDAYGAHLRGLK